MVAVLIFILSAMSIWLYGNILINIFAYNFIMLINGIFNPLANAMLAKYHETELTKIFALKSLSSSFNLILGPVISGFIIYKFGGVSVQWMTLLFAIILILLSIIIKNSILIIPTQVKKTSLHRLFLIKTEVYISSVAAIFNFVMQPLIYFMLPILILSDLKKTSIALSLVDVSFGLGMAVSSFFLIKKANKLIGVKFSTFIGAQLIAIGVFFVSLASNLSVIYVSLFFCGIGIVLFNVNTTTIRINATPEHFRSDVESATLILCTAFIPFGQFFFSKINEYYSIHHVLFLSSVILSVTAILILKASKFSEICLKDDITIKGIYKTYFPRAFT